MNNDYDEKLKHPYWQRQRLEKMDAAGWQCEICGDDKEELHVHHPQYVKGWEPWSYPLNMLECLCSTCHKLRHMPRDKVANYAKTERLNVRLVKFLDRPRFNQVSSVNDEFVDSRGRGELVGLEVRWRTELRDLVKRAKMERDAILECSFQRTKQARLSCTSTASNLLVTTTGKA